MCPESEKRTETPGAGVNASPKLTRRTRPRARAASASVKRGSAGLRNSASSSLRRAASGSMMPIRSAVAGEQKIGPVKPSRANRGK